MKLFKAWIPTVSGRLSFSEIGHTKTPTRCIYANSSDTARRYIVCYQGRDLSDALVPDFVRELCNRLFFRRQGKFWFVMLAHTGQPTHHGLDELRGCLFMISSKEDWKSGPENLKDKIKGIQRKLNDYDDSPGNIQLDKHIHKDFQKLKSDLLKISDYNVLFKLFRGGQVSLYCRDSDNKKGPSKFRNQYILVSQFYYFLRDLCHRHQHHDSKTDTILNMYESKFYEDFSWRREVLYSLFRSIIQAKRQREADQIMRAVGLLAYAEAFHSINTTDMAKGLPTYNFSALRRSLDASFDEIESRKNSIRGRIQFIFAWFISLTGLLISIAILGRGSDPYSTVQANSFIIDSYEFIVQNPLKIAIFTLFSLLFISTIQPIIFNIRKSRFFRALVALAHSKGRDTATAIFWGPMLIFIIWAAVLIF